MPRFGLSSLRVRLLLLVLLAVVPALGLTLHTANEQRRMAGVAAQEDALRLARVVAAGQDRLIEGARQILTALAQVPEVRSGDAAACDRLLASLLGQYPNYSNFGVIAPDGRVVCSGIPLSGPLVLADRPYFRGALDQRRFAIGEYQVGRITGKPSVNFGFPIVDEDVVRAVVFAALDLEWFNRLATEIDLPTGVELTVIDRNGTILVRQPNPESWVGKAVPQAPIIQAIRARGGEGTAEAQDVSGTLRLYGFTSLPSGPELSVFLSVGVPKDQVFAEIDALFRRNLFGLMVVAALALAAAWAGGDVFVLRQVRALVDATERVAAGDLGARTGMRGQGELNQLATAFDHMAGSLQEREREARRAADEIMLLQSTTMAISIAEDLPSALAIVLRTICDATLWRCGRAWVPEDGGGKLVSCSWYAGGPEAEAFCAAPSAGLAERAWARKAPMWEPDVTYGGAIAQTATAPAAEIKGGLAVPVLAANEVVAVMEFHVQEAHPDNERLTRSVAAVAAQLGTLIRRKHAEDQVRHLAYFDALTGLPNRVQFHDRIGAAIADAHGHPKPLAVLALGVERFKEINYTLGAENGNDLLRQIGPRLRAALDETDVLAYLGGRHFAVLLPQGGVHAASEAAARMLKALEEPFQIAGVTVEVGASIGIAVFPGHGRDASELMRHADVALYKAERDGTGQAHYDPQQDFYNPRRLQLMGELRTAIAEDQLALYCQPKLDLAANTIVAVESLLRWRHPSIGLVPPDVFIPLVETTGLIGPLTRWALDTALARCHVWRQAGVVVPIAVNLSARNLTDRDFVDYVRDALATWGAGTDWIDFEITESAVMVDPHAALIALGQLHEAGFRLFIDDFGTGYSSLAYLQKLPINAIKIDKSFVETMLQDKDAEVIVRSTIEMGHNLGLKVVAEGVETGEMCRRLSEFGCDEAQGYYVSPPLPADQFTGWLQSAKWPIAAN